MTDDLFTSAPNEQPNEEEEKKEVTHDDQDSEVERQTIYRRYYIGTPSNANIQIMTRTSEFGLEHMGQNTKIEIR